MYFEAKCTYVSFVILWQNTLKNFLTLPPPCRIQNVGKITKIVSCPTVANDTILNQIRPPNFPSQFLCFSQNGKMQLMRFAVHLFSCSSVRSVCTTVSNISLFQPMLVFFCRIKRILLNRFTDDNYVCGWTSVLQFSWNGTMLRTDGIHCSYITQ